MTRRSYQRYEGHTYWPKARGFWWSVRIAIATNVIGCCIWWLLDNRDKDDRAFARSYQEWLIAEIGRDPHA